jgi:hypothetical protein
MPVDAHVNPTSTAREPAAGKVHRVHPDRLGREARMTIHRPHRLASLIAAGITAAALAAPAAVARPIDGPNEPIRPGPGPTVVEPEPSPAPAPVVRMIDDGFDWGSAAIGAGGAGALIVLIALGGFTYASRNRLQATS